MGASSFQQKVNVGLASGVGACLLGAELQEPRFFEFGPQPRSTHEDANLVPCGIMIRDLVASDCTAVCMAPLSAQDTVTGSVPRVLLVDTNAERRPELGAKFNRVPRLSSAESSARDASWAARPSALDKSATEAASRSWRRPSRPEER